MNLLRMFFFFFQAEDGIRDHCVTGVQTCALPISRGHAARPWRAPGAAARFQPVRSEARFPAVERRDGHYESFYIKATQPSGGRGVWIRHTVHKRPDEEPTAAIWLTLFDAGAPSPRATKASFGADQLSAPQGAYI